MSLADWIQRLLRPSTADDPDGAPEAVVGNAPTFAELEDAEAAEGAVEATDPPPDL